MVKDNEKVKNLFIDVSDRLFSKHGYENVSVDTICKEAGKAKGLFFYYFDKKENIVKLMLENQVQKMSKSLYEFVTRDKHDSVYKMNYMMNLLISKDTGAPKAMYYFKNELPEWIDSFAHSLKDKYIFPIILKIVSMGIEENVFEKCSPRQVKIIYLGISQFMHRYFDSLNEGSNYEDTVRDIGEVLDIVLGCKKGTITIS